MAEQGHTKLPWTAHKQEVKGPSGVAIARTWKGGSSHSEIRLRVSGPEAQANAEFIVRACNCHDALVEACKCIDIAAPGGDDPDQPDGGATDGDLVAIFITEKGLRDLRAALSTPAPAEGA